MLAQSSPGMAVEPTVSKTVDGSVIPVHAGEEGLAYVYAISNPVTSFGSSCEETGHSVSLLLIVSSQLVFDPSSSFQMIGNEGVQLCQTYDNCSEPVESDTAEVGVGPMKAVAAGSKKVQSSTTEVRISPMKAVRAGCKKVYDRKNFLSVLQQVYQRKDITTPYWCAQRRTKGNRHSSSTQGLCKTKTTSWTASK